MASRRSLDVESAGVSGNVDSRSSISLRPHLSTTMSNTATSQPRFSSSGLRSASIAPQGSDIDQSVRLFKIFEALRNGDTVAISKATKEDAVGGSLDGTTILHLAIQCAEQTVVEYVLSQSEQNVNARDRDGNTPLHIAASTGRVPVVKLLLRDSTTNESIANYQGKTALDVSRNAEIFQALQLAKSIFVEKTVQNIHRLVAAGRYEELETLLEDERVRTTVDVNGSELATDPATTEVSGSLLHEAARKKDTKLAQLLLLNGADPFRRDRNGKLPQDVTKDEKTRAIIKRSPAAQVAQRSIQEKSVLGESGQNPGGDAGPGSKDSREIKGYLRKWTNYTSGYKLRFFVLEDGVLSYYKHQDDAGSACRGAINMKIARLQMDPRDKLSFEIHGKSSVKYLLKANHQVEAKRWFWALNNAIQWAKDETRGEQKRQEQEAAALNQAREEHLERQRTRESESGVFGLAPPSNLGRSHGTGASSPYAASTFGDHASGYAQSEAAVNIPGENDAEGEEFDDASSHHELQPDFKDALSVTAQSIKLQIELLSGVSAALQSQTREQPDLSISSPAVVKALSSYDTAVGNLHGLLADLFRMARHHETHWQSRLDREQNMRRLWEESMARVAREQEEVERLYGESEDKRKKTKRALREALEGQGLTEASGQNQQSAIATAPVLRAGLTEEVLSDDESEDEEQFFDAIDAGEVEVAEAMPPATSSDVEVADVSKDLSLDKDLSVSFKGYEDPVRKRLKLDADNRPKISLWGILKSMIGKDMTKMTLPVTFNEPTSLLYRVVEDMEYTDLLTQAATRPDSLERLILVAGFAASEYASTIGRVAKPFNPLLGETYEYSRPDLGYRFFIEQVSHHPPVGAAYAEGARWRYYGQSAVRSKFYGKSFEINPLGTWYTHLVTPDGTEELYTWKKVTTSVVGIITGNPVVDNHGPMEIKNWTTGEVCHLDFKPRGWKANSAYQVSGKVVGKDGNTVWSIGGRWNDKIYARFTPGYEAAVDAPGSGKKPDRSQAFTVWEAHERPMNIPFYLTPFAVTLNALPDRLRPFLPPTDSRLRPDQRAMEEGDYDFAASEKTRLEDEQRARRRTREENGEHFEPRWFKTASHPTTNEEYWDFKQDYWDVREAVAQGKRSWKDEQLEPLFEHAAGR